MFRKIRLTVAVSMLLSFFVFNLILLINFPAAAAQIRVSADSGVISINSKGAIFNIGNMAPGDSYETFVTVYCDDEVDVFLSSFRERGDKSLYKKLLVTIRGSDGFTYYTGSLSAVKNIFLGNLKKEQDKRYSFCVFFPGDAGNEYQGKSISASFVFSCRTPKATAGYVSSGVSENGGSGLHNTGKGIDFLITAAFAACLAFLTFRKGKKSCD